MPGDPRLRASDADRERTVNVLREHHAEGRLDIDEFHERLNAAYEAKTIGDLDALVVDLPAIDLYRLPSAGLKPAPVGSWPRPPAQWRGRPPGGPVGRLGWLQFGPRHRLADRWGAAGGLAWLPWFLLIIIPWAVALRRRA